MHYSEPMQAHQTSYQKKQREKLKERRGQAYRDRPRTGNRCKFPPNITYERGDATFELNTTDAQHRPQLCPLN